MTKRQSETEPAAKFVAKVDGFLGAAQRLHNYLARVGQSPSLAETAFSLAPSAKSSLFETFPLEYKQWDLDHFPRRKMPHSYAPEFVAIVMDQVRDGRPLAQVARSAKNYSSAPYRPIGRHRDARATAASVQFFLDGEQPSHSSVNSNDSATKSTSHQLRPNTHHEAAAHLGLRPEPLARPLRAERTL